MTQYYMISKCVHDLWLWQRTLCRHHAIHWVCFQPWPECTSHDFFSVFKWENNTKLKKNDVCLQIQQSINRSILSESASVFWNFVHYLAKVFYSNASEDCWLVFARTFLSLRMWKFYQFHSAVQWLIMRMILRCSCHDWLEIVCQI